jgi:hypothetical protein
MPLLAVILGATMLIPVWRFTPGQEFFVEETHRQLLTVAHDSGAVSTYIDYSAVVRYKVTHVRGDRVTIDATIERIRINNTTEAGGRAVESIKQREKSKTTWRLRRTSAGWESVGTPTIPDTAPPIFLTLGGRIGPENQSWQQSWSATLPSGPATLRMTGKVRQNTQSPHRFELRPEWVSDHPHVRLTTQPTQTGGIGMFDITRGRWFYVDFRLRASLMAHRNGRQVEMKQDLTSYYRLSDQMPPPW